MESTSLQHSRTHSLPPLWSDTKKVSLFLWKTNPPFVFWSLFPHLLKDLASAVISFLLCLLCPLLIYSHQYIDTPTSLGSPMSMGSLSQPPLSASPSLPILPTESIQGFASTPFIFLTNLIQPRSFKYHQFGQKMSIFALLASLSLLLRTCILLWTWHICVDD